jgi:hypothetical protein
MLKRKGCFGSRRRRGAIERTASAIFKLVLSFTGAAPLPSIIANKFGGVGPVEPIPQSPIAAHSRPYLGSGTSRHLPAPPDTSRHLPAPLTSSPLPSIPFSPCGRRVKNNRHRSRRQSHVGCNIGNNIGCSSNGRSRAQSDFFFAIPGKVRATAVGGAGLSLFCRIQRCGYRPRLILHHYPTIFNWLHYGWIWPGIGERLLVRGDAISDDENFHF